jgi:hypothetical protein
MFSPGGRFVNSVEVCVVVEGQTEQAFVRHVLGPEMAKRGIYLHAALIGKPGHKGGAVRFERAARDIGIFLAQRTGTFVSTMVDFFRIDPEWPGRRHVENSLQSGARLTAAQKAEILETAMRNEISAVYPELRATERFVPYIEMHEFEALLFSDVVAFSNATGIPAAALQSIRESYPNPEEINEDPENAPSRQIYRRFPGYRKVAMGKAAAEAIGIPAMRDQCPHFHDWLARLENLRS